LTLAGCPFAMRPGSAKSRALLRLRDVSGMREADPGAGSRCRFLTVIEYSDVCSNLTKGPTR
jgi:hypothetical protein